MPLLIDAFWRAAVYCLHPRVVAWTLLPLLLAAALALGLGVLYWEAAVGAVRAALDGWALTAALLQWLDAVGAPGLRALLAPMIVVALALPVAVVLSLLLVGVLATPALVALVAQRRFPGLEARRGASAVAALLHSLGLAVAALVVLVLSVPLWLIPPLALLVPPLVWGWLAARVLSFDALAVHADADERRRVLAAHRWPLLAMGVVCGLLGAVPSLLWAASALTLVFAPLLVVLSVWLYTLIFAFSSLWFAHYLLAALQAWRAVHPPAVDAAPASAAPALLPHPLH